MVPNGMLVQSGHLDNSKEHKPLACEPQRNSQFENDIQRRAPQVL